MLTTSYIVSKINDTELTQAPWPHLEIDDMLPEVAYQQLKHMVANTHDGVKDSAAMEHQTIIDLKETTDNVEFWNEWFKLFESAQVKQALLAKFNINADDFSTVRFDIHKCFPGFVLNVHNDVKPAHTHIVSLQIYLPADHTAEDDGVRLLDADEQSYAIPFVPNKAWAFSCSDETYHNVPHCTQERHSILMKFIINR